VEEEVTYMTWQEYVAYRKRLVRALRKMISAKKELKRAQFLFNGTNARTWSTREAGVTSADRIALDVELGIEKLYKELRELERDNG
jgi:hypothetical protein